MNIDKKDFKFQISNFKFDICAFKGVKVQIEAVTLREIHMPLVHFFETSFGRTTERRIVLLTVQTDGAEGWGECVAGEDPFYSEESADTAWYAVEKYLVPMAMGGTLEKAADLPGLLTRVRGHRMATAGLEKALWDAESRTRTSALRGSIRASPPAHASA